MKITKAIQKLIDDAVYAERKRIDKVKYDNSWKGGYATWRINLELIGDLDGDYFGRPDDIGSLADAIESYVDEVLDSSESTGLVRDYADAFVSNVDWYEIARNFASDNNSIAYDENGDLIDESEDDESDE